MENELSLNRVAQQINISPNYLSAVFSQEMGCTLTEYLTEKRMEKARELLRSTTKRSGEIAFEVGYKDAHYFSFLFKKSQGCTPRDYRAGRGKP
ncbi:HTH-type transcriptional activator Btr [bioreactor metagenome]|uniref:HTH-type transcriptional activator Btr n=1 Tax=bioreactor metagenome TaxID=1076179 RepID=A0A645E2L0_9ZZZZ